jgi:Mn-dependent DtxR family transcriptional regulator
MAQMLGVRRPTVSEIAGRLQDTELIRYRRGQMTIVDRGGLLDTTCDCYRIVKAEFDALTEGNT